jgi:hypothetical protein
MSDMSDNDCGEVQDVGDDQLDDPDDQPGGEDYATLHANGPQTSAGSISHPDECMPCTFYCFTRRGCNRGHECRFCHLSHQSKLQMRRECWKKQQREKRKSIRERVAQEAIARRNAGGKTNARREVAQAGGDAATALSSGNHHAYGRERQNGKTKPPDDLHNLGELQKATHRLLELPGTPFTVHFGYTPSEATLTIGQSVELWPTLRELPARFHLAALLPQGLNMDTATGCIRGVPTQAVPRSTVVVEATPLRGPMLRATVDIEVVDFTRGGFVIGHMSELEPGKFMLLMYVPDGEDPARDELGSLNQLSNMGGARPTRKANASRRGEQTLGGGTREAFHDSYNFRSLR